MSIKDEFANEFNTDPIKSGDGGKARDFKRVSTQDLDEAVAVIFPFHSEWADSTVTPGTQYNQVFADVVLVDGYMNKALKDHGATGFPYTITQHMFSDKQITYHLRKCLGQAVPVRFNSRPGQKAGKAMGIAFLDANREPEELLRKALDLKRAHVPTTAEDFLKEREGRKANIDLGPSRDNSSDLEREFASEFKDD